MAPTREKEKVPGWDCRVSCPHEPKGDHGRHCEEWWYRVRAPDGKSVLSFAVWTPFGVAPIPEEIAHIFRYRGTHLALHCEFGHVERECPFFAGRPCWVAWDSLLAGEAFGQRHFAQDDGFDQGEQFWVALEERWRELDAKAREEVGVA